MAKSLYFAYGSNMSQEQMAARCPGARLVCKAIIHNHALAFAGYSHRWGGAVATLLRAAGAQTEGLLYELPRGAINLMDRYEGHPHVYRREQRRVLNEYGAWRRAYVYVMPEDAERSLAPKGYLSVIYQEYKRYGFDLGALAVAADVLRQPWVKRQLQLRGVA